MMSGFHALFSLGGILGAALVSLLLWAELSGPLGAAWVTAAAGLALLALSAPGLLPYGDDVPEDGGPAPFLVVPRGAVVVIGILCLLAFLGEGAVLDWSAVFLRTERGVDPSLAGLGYAMFSVAMTVGRFTGDAVRTWLGETRVLFWGGVLSAAGFLIAVLVPVWWLDLGGFLLVGVGAANIVPVLFSATGRTHSMPPGLAIASVTTLGYAGILAGPAALGFIARATDLSVSLALVALAMLAVGLCRRVAER